MAVAPIPLTLTNGIYLQSREYNADIHLDTAHLMHMHAGKSTDATDLGMINPWITTGNIERPAMWDLIGKGKNRLLTLDGKLFTYKQAIPDGPTYIVEDISGSDRAGQDGTTFKIKTNKRTFGNGVLITHSKFAGIEMYVTAEEIRKDGDGFVYTVKLNATNKKYKWYPKEFLTPGTILFQIGSTLGEYGQTYNDMGGTISTGGYREFYNVVGDSVAHAHFTCTRDAAISKISKECVIGLKDYTKVIEMYQLHPSSAAYDISRQGQSPVDFYMREKGMSQKDAMAQVKSEIVKTSWIPEVEKFAKLMVERDIENYAMWGAGGTLDIEGKTQTRLAVGAFHQLNMGPTYNYNLGNFKLSKLDAYIASRLNNKVEMYGTNVIRIGTGRGGQKLVRSQLKDVANQSNLVFDSERYVKGSDNQNLYLDLPNFMSYRMSFGIVEFVYIPSLDPVEANEIDNPIIDGHRLSSYMFIIDDLTAQNDNIYEVVNGQDWDFHHFYINGRMNYMDSKAFNASSAGPYQASNLNPGFEVYIEKPHKMYWIKDITRSLLIKPINPRTGKPLFEPVFN